LSRQLLMDAEPFTLEDLMTDLRTAHRLPRSWEQLPLEEMVAHVSADLLPEDLLPTLDWHVQEIHYKNLRESGLLKVPYFGRFIRDQHEINRLLWISIEKARDALVLLERETGRLFGHFRREDRDQWVRQFRYLGARWTACNQALRAFKEAWEWGRSPAFRLRSQAGQETLNPLAETCLCALAEALAALHSVLYHEPASPGEPGPGSVRPDPELPARLESCLWHAREGRSLREQKTALRSILKAPGRQASLNRLYGIALEEISHILKVLGDELCHQALAMEQYLAVEGR